MYHLPSRPDWTCRTCGDPWPCVLRRADLLAEYLGHPAELAMFLAVCMADAAKDLDTRPGELVERFLGWIRPAALAA
ncbi:MAG TPA: hypothetical protein VHA75_08105 [Rugosimonospora sp.]|nr:hypothetical protein [Rugosimonospora sp.]